MTCDCEPKPEVVSLIVKNERERIAEALKQIAADLTETSRSNQIPLRDKYEAEVRASTVNQILWLVGGRL